MKWDLTNYYKNYEEFRDTLEKAKALVNDLSSYEGKLKNENDLIEFYKLMIEFYDYEKLYLYAECALDIDQRNTKALADMQEIMYLFNTLSEATSWVDNEILSLGEEYVIGVIDKNPELEQFRYEMSNLFRQQSHTPSKDAQKVLANFGALISAGSDQYDALSTADQKEKIVKLNDGCKVDIRDANWTSLVGKSKDPKERKKIFEAEFSRYEDYKFSFASIYNAILKGNIAIAKSRGFDSSLEMHLFPNNIPLSLYNNLIKVAHKAAPTVKKYYKLKKKALGLKSYHTYDRFLDLVSETSDKEYSYEEAKNLFFDSIEKFPEEFKMYAKEALKDGYVDVMPGVGKRSGAYSNSTTNTHPCILLNFTGNLDSCFTLAHEAGHSIHSLFSNNNQPTATQGYTIFVAEIASTFNEHNLLDYLLTKGELSKNDKILLIQNAIDGICSTFIRQTLFAEYELKAFEMAEKGLPVTEESLSNIMVELYKAYYSIDITKEKGKKYVWAYVSHFFHSPFYVYQYATSYSASLAIYQNVKNNIPHAFENYINLLKSGGSDYPINLVKKAGVDFTKLDPLKAVVDRLNDLYKELEALINE